MKPSSIAVSHALTYMINRSDFFDLKAEIEQVVKASDYAMFVPPRECLNVLVELGRAHGLEALNPIWDIAYRNHYEAYPNLKRVTDLKDPQQAVYMAARRKRLRRAELVYNRVKDTTLSPKDRRTFHKTMQATWVTWRDNIVRAGRTGEERSELISSFWEEIEDLLDKAESGDDEAAQKVLGLDE